MYDQAGKILIIEDDRKMRDMLSRKFKNDGYTVITAQDGKEGIEKAKELEIDMVITDIKMPEMDGYAVLEKIKEINPDIEIIMITGCSEYNNAIDSLKKGAYDYVTKPFNLDTLALIVSNALLKKQLTLKRSEQESDSERKQKARE